MPADQVIRGSDPWPFPRPAGAIGSPPMRLGETVLVMGALGAISEIAPGIFHATVFLPLNLNHCGVQRIEVPLEAVTRL
ncbi:MAG: hypothetical protein AB7F39_06735 [Variibacter sp.]